MPVSHSFVSAVADGSTVGEVLTLTDWNNKHISTITNSSLVFREVLARSANITSSNTSAVSTLINYVVPARLLSSNRMLRWTMVGDFSVASTAVLNSFRLEVIDNSSRWADLTSTQATALANQSHINMQVFIAPTGTSGTRKMFGLVEISSRTAGATFGVGDHALVGAGGTRHLALIQSSGVYTVTTGAESTFAVQFNWLAANSSLSFRMRYSYLELV